MSDAALFAVTFDADPWLTPDQLETLEGVLLRWARPQHAEQIAGVLRHAGIICLDTALLGMVIAHESGGYHNRLYWQEFGPSAKVDAGWPVGLWLPPRQLNEEALEVLRARLVHAADSHRAVEWATWQLDNWWRFAAVFETDSVMSGMRDDGSVVLNTLTSPARASPHATGEVLYKHTADNSGPRCAATWTVHVISDRVREVQDRQCVFPASSGPMCRVHTAVGL